MFGWLAKMLVTTPVQGSSCACCESKKKELERMQHVIGNGGVEEEQKALPVILGTSSYYAEYKNGRCYLERYGAKQ